MKTEVFPINYFKSIWTPLEAFRNRFKLTWPNIIVVLIFLNGLLTIPVTINFAQIDHFPIDDLYPNSANILKNEQLDELSDARYENGQMKVETPFIYENEYGMVSAGINAIENEQIEESENAVIFEENQFIIKEEGLPTARVPYTEKFTLEQVNSHEGILNVLSEQWFVQNQVFFVAIFTLIVSILQFVMMLFIIFGSAVFLYFTKNSPITSIETYKESVNLVINAISLPTIIATLFGLISFNIITIQMIQVVGLLAMLMIIYFKIQFNDDKLKENRNK